MLQTSLWLKTIRYSLEHHANRKYEPNWLSSELIFLLISKQNLLIVSFQGIAWDGIDEMENNSGFHLLFFQPAIWDHTGNFAFSTMTWVACQILAIGICLKWSIKGKKFSDINLLETWSSFNAIFSLHKFFNGCGESFGCKLYSYELIYMWYIKFPKKNYNSETLYRLFTIKEKYLTIPACR